MTHVNLSKQHPAVYQGVAALSQQVNDALAQAGIEATFAELVRIRVSQLNGCAFCLRMHTREAIAQGETTDRIAVLAAWWESQYFTEQERAALALAEEVTQLPVPEPRQWDDGSLTDEQVSAISWLTIVMNTLNRVAIRSHYPIAP